MAYQIGTGVAKDLAQALTLYHKACDGGSAMGCNELGNNYMYARGVPKDLAQAAVFFRKACDASDAGTWGCNNLGLMYDNG